MRKARIHAGLPKDQRRATNCKWLDLKVGHAMAMKWRRAAATSAILMAALLMFVLAGAAQNASNTETFKTRLSPVPINISMMATVAGSGALTATLSGRELTIQGTFEGLRSPATSAQIHRGPKGIPGPAVAGLDLTVTKAEKGSVSGTLDLTPDQIADLRNGRLYLQIQSERAPDGNLWGWLLR
ncbi:MAG TPA: CHRD domain-containing protein [Candidatus Acidoferrales bacterium]|nr:CHRD domain-containing protein [Candidatus Acidoferrales bacterium]